jgi:hypothetical protein
MSHTKTLREKSGRTKSAVHQALQWTADHPETLILGSLAVGTFLASKLSKERPQAHPVRRPETEADCVEGETPLFI